MSRVLLGVVIVLQGVGCRAWCQSMKVSARQGLRMVRPGCCRGWREIRRKGISARWGVLSMGAAGRRSAKGIAGMEHRDSLESRAVTGFSLLPISFIPFIP